MEKEVVKSIIKEATGNLILYDKELIGFSIEDDGNARKLHEVCINHCLAVHLEKSFNKIINEEIFVDIEFNRRGNSSKQLNGKIVRPDIIVHNRKFNGNKRNILVVEAKKKDSCNNSKNKDRNKINGFLTNSDFHYFYGLFIQYDLGTVISELYWLEDDKVKMELI